MVRICVWEFFTCNNSYLKEESVLTEEEEQIAREERIDTVRGKCQTCVWGFCMCNNSFLNEESVNTEEEEQIS